MRKSATTVFALALFLSSFGQTPQALNYQAVARNSLGQIVPSQAIGVRFTIMDATGNTVYYQETHNTTTNNFGLFTLAIGKGTAVSGGIGPIDWSTGGDKFLKVEIAPQGGTNYTVQGTTQLLSVPYSLYSEKTKLLGGNAITITNGNTINANYVAGTGINITGNTISSNAWLLNGNGGTTAANFIGTTDDQRLYFRTNNKARMFLEKSTVTSGSDVGILSLSDEAGSATNPGQLNIWGREIVGYAANMAIINNVVGQTWGQAVGNTQGRMIRFSQMTTPLFTQSQFYDLGISQDSSFYISDHWFQNGGPNTPKKMITISPQNLVGINLNNSEKPTANFHTKGSVRFQGLTSNNTLNNVLVTDANGNVSMRDASTFGGGSAGWALLGNGGTTPANFLGTTDDQRLYFRTNNKMRMFIEQSTVTSGSDVGILSLSDEAGSATNPGQLNIWGREIVGYAANMAIINNVVGQTWGQAVGNTQGRMIRFSQMTTPLFTQSQFYDLGISQDSSFYISDHWFQNGGPNTPKKMITISPQNLVGINLNNSEKPTANFHTKGSVRFQGLATNNTFTNLLMTDANGNVAMRDINTLPSGFWVADAAGIHNNNSTNHVGIGAQSNNQQTLNVELNENTLDGRPVARFSTNDSWQTNLWLYNSSNNASFSLIVGGSANTLSNYGVGANGFGIANQLTPTTTIPIIITSDNKVGISNSLGGTDNMPKSRLHVRDGDVYIDQIGSGVIMKSPNGQCWRMTVSDTGTPVFTAIPCP